MNCPRSRTRGAGRGAVDGMGETCDDRNWLPWNERPSVLDKAGGRAMNLALLLLGALGLLALLFAALLGKPKPTRKSTHQYRIGNPLLTRAERSFYGVLLQAVQGEAITVFAKVRVADVLAPAKGADRSAWRSAFNAISAKHFDFVLCSPADCSVRAVVELDDPSHARKARKRRDDFLDAACESAGLPLLHFYAARGYVMEEVRTKLVDVLGITPTADASVAHEAPRAPVAPDPHESSEVQGRARPAETGDENGGSPGEAAESAAVSEAPACPKCGAATRLMKPKAGVLAGQVFWGCSTFPQCRGAKRLDTTAQMMKSVISPKQTFRARGLYPFKRRRVGAR